MPLDKPQREPELVVTYALRTRSPMPSDKFSDFYKMKRAQRFSDRSDVADYKWLAAIVRPWLRSATPQTGGTPNPKRKARNEKTNALLGRLAKRGRSLLPNARPHPPTRSGL